MIEPIVTTNRPDEFIISTSPHASFSSLFSDIDKLAQCGWGRFEPAAAAEALCYERLPDEALLGKVIAENCSRAVLFARARNVQCGERD